MTLTGKRTLKIFLVLITIHAIVFVLYPGYVLKGINERIAWFGVNAYPWWPLYQLGLPVSHRVALIRPNALGWAWSGLVWVLFYWGIARLLVRAFGKAQSDEISES